MAEARSSPAGVGSVATPSSVEGAAAKTTGAANADRAAGLDRKASGVSDLERPEVTVLVDGQGIRRLKGEISFSYRGSRHCTGTEIARRNRNRSWKSELGVNLRRHH